MHQTSSVNAKLSSAPGASPRVRGHTLRAALKQVRAWILTRQLKEEASRERRRERILRLSLAGLALTAVIAAAVLAGELWTRASSSTQDEPRPLQTTAGPIPLDDGKAPDRSTGPQPSDHDQLFNHRMMYPGGSDLPGAIRKSGEDSRFRDLVDRGTARLRGGNPEAALLDFDAALLIHPLDLEARSARAETRLKLGDQDGAREDYETLLGLAPADWKGRSQTLEGLHNLGARER